MYKERQTHIGIPRGYMNSIGACMLLTEIQYCRLQACCVHDRVVSHTWIRETHTNGSGRTIVRETRPMHVWDLREREWKRERKRAICMCVHVWDLFMCETTGCKHTSRVTELCLTYESERHTYRWVLSYIWMSSCARLRVANTLLERQTHIETHTATHCITLQ